MKIARPLLISFACIIGVTTTSVCQAADDEYQWKIGFASTKITPSDPVRMAGYASNARKQLSQGVSSDLFAKAMAIEDVNGNRGLLITTDLIGWTAAISEPLYERITAATRLSRRQVLINASHTHTGPAIGLDESKLDHLGNPEHVAATLAYTRTLVDKIVKLSIDATDKMELESITWGTGVATL